MDSQGASDAGRAAELVLLLRQLHERHEQRLTDLLDVHAKRLEQALAQGTYFPGLATSSSTLHTMQTSNQQSGQRQHLPQQTRFLYAEDKEIDCNEAVADISKHPLRAESKVRRSFAARSWQSLRSAFKGSNLSSFPGSDSSACLGVLDRKVKAVERQTKIFKERRKAEQQGQKNGVNVVAWSLTRSTKFETFWAVMIVFNAMSLGVQLDLCLKGSCELLVFQVLDYVFTAMFLLELAIRFCAEMRHFFSRRNPNLAWNVFDLVLVLFSVSTDLADYFTKGTTNVSSIRLLRVLRLTRAARLMRVLRFFTNLRLMIVGIASCAQSLVSAAFLLLLVIYIYAILVLQLVIDEMSCPQNSHAALLKKYYGSLVVTLYTLFGSVSGGLSWQDGAAPLVELHPFMRLASVVFIMFSVLCVMNVITGVFVENAFKIHNNDEDRAIFDLLEHRKHWIAEVKKLFLLADRHGTGFFNKAEFSALLRDVQVQHCFRKLGLEVEESSAKMLFALFDVDHSGQINLDEFAEGIQRVHGSARSIDVVQLLQSNRGMTRMMHELMHAMRDLHDLQKNCQIMQF